MNPQTRVVFDDGGRALAGFKGKQPGDCVCRSITIVTGRPYREIYDELNRLTAPLRKKGRRVSAREGVPKASIRKYLAALGFKWVPTMGIGTGCRVHLRAAELPPGRLIVNCSGHLTAVIDGVVHDTHDPCRGGTRCVYGFWVQPTETASQVAPGSILMR